MVTHIGRWELVQKPWGRIWEVGFNKKGLENLVVAVGAGCHEFQDTTGIPVGGTEV